MVTTISFFNAKVDNFRDQELRDISASTNKSVNEVAIEIARYLLLHFPSKQADRFPIKSPLLKSHITRMSRLYDSIVQAHFKQGDIQSLPLMQELFKQFPAHAITKADLVDLERKNALLFHEGLLTFPERYGINRASQSGYETRLYTFYDSESDNWERLDQLSDFFFKHYAVTNDLKFVTWQRHIANWSHAGGDAGETTLLTEHFFLAKMAPTTFSNPRGTNLTLKIYTICKTMEELRKAIGFGFFEPFMADGLQERLEDPQFRMDCVFFCGNQGAPLNPSREADRWIIALMGYKAYLSEWRISEELQEKFFQWHLEAAKTFPRLRGFERKGMQEMEALATWEPPPDCEKT